MAVDREAKRREENRERVAEGFGCNPAPDLTHEERRLMRAFARDRIGIDNITTEFEGGWKNARIENMWCPDDENYEFDGAVA